MKQHAASGGRLALGDLTTFSGGSSRCFSHQAARDSHGAPCHLAEPSCHRGRSRSPPPRALLPQSFYIYVSANVDRKRGFSPRRECKGFAHLAAQLERVDLLPLLAQGLVHAAQVVAHHAQLVFVAPLGRGQLVLRERPQRQFGPAAAGVRGERADVPVSA